MNWLDPSGLVELNNETTHDVIEVFYDIPKLPENLPEFYITLCGGLFVKMADELNPAASEVFRKNAPLVCLECLYEGEL